MIGTGMEPSVEGAAAVGWGKVLSTKGVRLLPLARLELSETATWTPNPLGPKCPYCTQGGVRQVGMGVYLCLNPDCKGGGTHERPGKFLSVAVIDAVVGFRLEPYESGLALLKARKRNPSICIERHIGVAGFRDGWRPERFTPTLVEAS
jgi:hypothetical protein